MIFVSARRNPAQHRAFEVRMSRILLVEDDVGVREVVERVLADAGYEVDATGSANKACDFLCRYPYDLVIADAKLPDGTGMAVADDARANGIKSLIITGDAPTLPYGVFDRYEILLKPLRLDDLLEFVASRLTVAA